MSDCEIYLRRYFIEFEKKNSLWKQKCGVVRLIEMLKKLKEISDLIIKKASEQEMLEPIAGLGAQRTFEKWGGPMFIIHIGCPFRARNNNRLKRNRIIRDSKSPYASRVYL